MNVLLINGHQSWEGFAEGRLNQTIIDETQKQLTNVGYTNPSQFSREFKNLFGLAPRQLLKTMTEQ